MISDLEAEKAADFLRENAKESSRAKAHRIYMEELRKHVKANLIQKSGAKTFTAAENDAYAHPDYKAHLKELKDAVEADEFNRNQREASIYRIETWRTQRANERGR